MRTLSETVRYQGRVITVREDVLESDHGPLRRDLVLHPGAVVLIPILDESVLFVRQFRYAAGCELLELPAGTLESGEGAASCAQRELREETGYRAESLTPLGEGFAAPGYSSERLFFFLAENLVTDPKDGDIDEDIAVERVALRDLETVDLRDAKTGMGLWLLKRALASR